MAFLKSPVAIHTFRLTGIAVAAILIFPLFSYRAPNTSVKQTDSLREEIPIYITYDNQRVTPYIDVNIGGKIYQAVFDTGSSGLRILDGALNGGQGQLTDTINQGVKHGLGDDKHVLLIRGKVLAMPMQFGRLKSIQPIRLMSIDSTQYGPDAPWTLTRDSALIKSNHFRGLPAIMGVGLRLTAAGKGVASPFAQLPGNGIFIVEFPSFGRKTGKVILNPTPGDAEGFKFFHLQPGKVKLPGGYSSWIDNQLDGCIALNDGSACLPTMLDCGAPDIEVFSDHFKASQSLARGEKVTAQIRDKLDTTIFVNSTFIISDARQHGKDYVYLKPSKNTGKNLFGTRFFFDYDILYDAKHGLIGLRKK